VVHCYASTTSIGALLFIFTRTKGTLRDQFPECFGKKHLTPIFLHTVLFGAISSFFSSRFLKIFRIFHISLLTLSHEQLSSFEFFSSLQGIGTIIISYFVGKTFLRQIENANLKMQNDNAKLKMDKFSNNLTMKQFNNYSSLLLPFLIATSPGLIQASHFGTFESSLTFLYFLIFYLCLRLLVGVSHGKPLLLYIIAVIIFGIAVSIKVTSLVLFPVLFFIFFIIVCRGGFLTRPRGRVTDPPLRQTFQRGIKLIYLFSLLIFIPIFIFVLSNPFSFDFFKFQISNFKFSSLFSSDFLSTMNYESSVARGTMNVFYTQQFQDTIPIVYQFTKVLPYVLNPVIFIVFLISIISLILLIFHRETIGRASLLIIFFFLIFLPNSLLYVKWTRYIIPSLPYIYIFVFLFLKRFARLSLILPICLISLIFSLFFTSIYSFDTRVEAASWTKTNLKPSSKIISEVYDMGVVPFNEVFNYRQIQLFNFYDLDDKYQDVQELQELRELIKQADVIVLPSRRIIDTRLRLRAQYPNGAWFYTNLLNGNFGFHLAKEFSHPYDRIIPGLSPDESFTVFDHPEVTIFTK